ncbi:MAG TPA: ATP-binding protein [Gemmatimonadaceae bacterium]|nr:ATP-binding protein [Gemmatimonadaceae bacterium]
MKTRQNILSALQESEARYQHLVESTSDGIYRINLPGHFLYANPIACRVLGGGESIVGRHYLEFVRPDFHDDMRQFYARQVRDRTPITYYEFPAVAADGTGLWIGQRVHIELDDRDTVVGLHAIARDITDKKRLEDDLRQADKMRVVGQLAGGVAHDFNAILTAIAASADVLIQSLGPNDARTRTAEEIRKAASTGERLTSQLLTFSRRDLFRPQALNVNHVIEELRPMVEQLLGASITLQITLDPSLGDVRADTAQIEQVLVNLSLNARDAMPAGGRLTIRTENTFVEAGPIANATLYPGSYVVLTVSDTGAGMDEATQEKIFEPFFTTKAHGQGNGLGLSTIFGIVNQAAGRITVESAPGAGTTVQIHIPQIRKGATAYPTPPRSLPIEHRGGVVLVADDEDGVRTVLTRVLEANGYHVISAINGIDALDKAKAHPGTIDVLLTDLVMPQMGGFELAEAFSNERPTSQVLFMSGYVDQRGLDYGIGNTVRLLHKPFDSDTVLSEVKRMMPPARLTNSHVES